MELRIKKVVEYLTKYPETPSLTLARKLKLDFPLLFPSLDAARSAVRYQRGTHGKINRKRIKNPMNHKTIDPNRLPKSYTVDRKPHRIPASCRNVLIISDLHIPYHNKKAIEIALNDGLQNNADCIIINGDLLDFHHLSRFQKDPHKRKTKQEFEAAREFLIYLREMFPAAHIVWNEGNHDARYTNWLASHALEIFDDAYYSLNERLGLQDLAIHFVSQHVLTYAGKLSISHGHNIVRGIFAPVNAARGVFLKTKESHLIGHTHSVSEHTEKRLSKEIITTWSTGCLCELNPDYDPFVNKASHGYAFVTLDAKGNYSVRNYRIYNGVRL